MAELTAEVKAALDERSSQNVANQLIRDMTRAGQVSGEAYSRALESAAQRSNVAMDRINADVVNKLTGHGARAGRGFGTAFGSELAQSLPGVSGFASAMSGYESAAGRMGAVAGRALGLAFTTAAAGLVGAAAYTIFKGFERYESIDAARNRLENLNRTMANTGRAAYDVGAVMQTVQDVVQDTPFALDQAFSVATQALSSSTGDLNRFMTNVADTAAFLQKPIGDVGKAFLDVANQGNLGMEQLSNELEGLPVDWIAQAVGKTSAEVMSMMKKNEVGLKDLMKAVETNVSGFAKGSVTTVSGAMEQVSTAVARLGANFLGAIFGKPTEDANGLVEALNAMQARIDDVNTWVTEHQDDIKSMFETAASAAGDFLEILGRVGGWFAENRTAIYVLGTAIGTAFAASKLAGFISSLQTITGLLGTAGGAGIAGQLASISALGSAWALPVIAGAGLGATAFSAMDAENARANAEANARAAVEAATNRGAPVNPLDLVLGGGSTPGQTPSLLSPDRRLEDMLLGGGPSTTPGTPLPGTPGGGPGPAGAPILDPTGAAADSGDSSRVQLPYPAEYGRAPLAGESPELYQARMADIKADHDLALAQARLNELQADANADANDVVAARNAVVDAEMRARDTERRMLDAQLTTSAATAPFDPRYGAAPRPGQTSAQYSAESSFYEAQQKRAQAEAAISQLQASGATTEQLAEANNELTKARNDEYQAHLRLQEAYKGTSEQLDEVGAKLDADFGASKGLAGIAENITKFLANLAFAPVLGALQAVKTASGYNAEEHGSGLLGMLFSGGSSGSSAPAAGMPNVTPGGGIPTASTSATPAAAPQAGGGYPGDAALLANVPAGRYTQEARGDLTQGLADCSSAVEDLVNIMDGRPTGGASMWTGNAAEWLTERGFLPGKGGPGDFRVGFNEGHMQATLPGGTPFNWGSDAAAAVGGRDNSLGADDPAFTSHYYRPAGGPGVGGAAGASGGYQQLGSAPFGSIPIPLPVTIVGGSGGVPGAPSGAEAPAGTPASGVGTGPAPGGGGLNWDALAAKESGGDWGINTGNGYYGGLQFDQATWNQYKPPGAPDRADLATKDQQIQAAMAGIQARGGPQSLWPENYGQLGWTGGQAAPAGVPTASPGPGTPGYVPGTGYVDSQGSPTGYNPALVPPGLPGTGGGSTLPGAGMPQGLMANLGVGGPAAPSQSVMGGRSYGQGLPASPGVGLGGGLIGLAGSAIQSGIGAAGMAGDAAGGFGGGTAAAAVIGAAAQIGIDEINRAIGAGAQYVGAGVGGLLETFSLNDSALADPGQSWLGRIGIAATGMRPALPNTAGMMGGEPNPNMAEGGKKPPPPGLTPQQAEAAKAGDQKGKGDVKNTFNTTVNNQRATEDGTGRDIQRHLGATTMAGAGMGSGG